MIAANPAVRMRVCLTPGQAARALSSPRRAAVRDLQMFLAREARVVDNRAYVEKRSSAAP